MTKSYDFRWVSVHGENGRKWSIKIKAKLDTGAKRSSIDIALARSLELEQIGEVTVRNAMGKQTRPLFKSRVRIGRKTYSVEITGADRSHLKCPMIIGKELLDSIDDSGLKSSKPKDDYPVFH